MKSRLLLILPCWWLLPVVAPLPASTGRPPNIVLIHADAFALALFTMAGAKKG